jgi:hypothetical protein
VTFSRPGRINRYAIEKSILEKSMGTVHPKDLETWTISEVFLFLIDPEERCPDGSPNMSETEIRAAAEEWAAKPPLEKLRSYRW